jgi:hypothetical protein
LTESAGGAIRFKRKWKAQFAAVNIFFERLQRRRMLPLTLYQASHTIEFVPKFSII